MAESLTYFRPVFYENATIFVPNFVGGWRDHTGAEALRRSSFDFHNYYRSRITAGPWIIPLMKIDVQRAKKQKTEAPMPDLFLSMGNIYATDAAVDVMRPFCGMVPDRNPTEEIEFFSVELVTGEPLWWVNPPVIPYALDEEKSHLSRSSTDNAILSINRPVMRRAALTADHIFDLRKDPRCPIFSDAVIDAFKNEGIGGVDWKPVEII